VRRSWVGRSSRVFQRLPVSTICLPIPTTGGGGIRSNNPPEVPGSVPYVHVADARAAFEKALQAGAEAMFRPERVTEGVTIALVRAPGGVPIGFSGP
jgi:predicted enzyme related to lactoylglutathione lyase